MTTLAELDHVYRTETHRIKSVSGDSFETVCQSINRAFPVQKRGRPMALSDTGEEYVEFFYRVPFRDSELGERVAREHAAREISRLLTDYAMDRSGPLYWRVLPEEDMSDRQVVGKFSEDGPDTEFLTLKRCWLEPGWKTYGIYMRLLISDKPALPG